MLIRIVRMTFQPDKTRDFLEIFKASSPLIRVFPGCLHLELLEDADIPAVYVTLSHWQNAGALEAYRQSALFKNTWAKTKPLFAAKPQAFSLEKTSDAW